MLILNRMRSLPRQFRFTIGNRGCPVPLVSGQSFSSVFFSSRGASDGSNLHMVNRNFKTTAAVSKMYPLRSNTPLPLPSILPCICIGFPRYSNNMNTTLYHFYSTASNKRDSKEEQQDENQTETTANLEKKDSKLKRLYHKYGRVAIGTYLSVYVCTLFSLFGLYDSGVLIPSDLPIDLDINHDGKVDMRDAGSLYEMVITRFKLEDYIDPSTLTPSQGNFILAWLTTKLTEPLRALVTIVLTPPIARKLHPEKFATNDKDKASA